MNKLVSAKNNGGNGSLRVIKRAQILRMILSGQQLSQAQIARRMGLGRPTVYGVVSDLKERELIEEIAVGKTTSRGGKPPLMLGVNGNRVHVLSIWIEGTRIRATLLSLKGELRDYEEVKISKDAALPDDIPVIVIKMILDMRKRLHRFKPDAELYSVGIAISGRVDLLDGNVELSINYQMKNFPLAAKIKEATGIPVYVADYPAVCAFYESWFGAAHGVDNFVFLRVLPFLKSVVFINGEPYFGTNLLAGEIGASLAKMGFEDTECLCDLIDHDIFGTPKITTRLTFPESVSGELVEPSYLESIGEFIDGLDNGKVNVEMSKLSKIIGQVIRNIVVYYNPELIILDGIPDQWQGEFLNSSQTALTYLKPLAPSAGCRFAFTKRDDDYKARAIMCMLFEQMLSVKENNRCL